MIRGPGLSPNSVVKSAVSSVDLFATIMDIAGLQKPSDGLSLLTIGTKDRTVLIEYKGEKSEDIPKSGCQTDSDPNLNVIIFFILHTDVFAKHFLLLFTLTRMD
jgi:hypothetical protein